MLPTEPTRTFPYRIHERIGEGGMGEVFRATESELDRPVAIKIIKPALLAELTPVDARDAAQRFLQEARAGAAFSHPGATVVHRVGTEAGVPYIAMEWLDGSTLEAVLAERGRLDVTRTARLGLQVLSVLEAAHAAGIVHRDIKPANLMITHDGRVKVTDFGIARMQGSGLAQTRAGLVVGTPHYAAPEQLAGKSIDHGADLYALGAVLYECLTGQPPIDAPGLYELLRRVQERVPLPVSVLVPGVPDALDAVLTRALKKRSVERYGSAREMAAALAPYAERREPERATAGSASRPTLPAPIPTTYVAGASPSDLALSFIRSWPAIPLVQQHVPSLLARLAERPLHASAFTGAVRIADACLFYADGVLHEAFVPAGDPSSDVVIERLPEHADAFLHQVPEGADARLLPLLAELPRLPNAATGPVLDAATTDVPALVAKLSAQGFDGIVSVRCGRAVGVVLLGKGARVLDLFGDGWPHAESGSWEEWVGRTDAVVAMRERQPRFPSLTFRQQLAGAQLDVERPVPNASSSLLYDTRAEASTIVLTPAQASADAVPHASSTLRAMVEADPAFARATWMLRQLGPQLERFARANRWAGLAAPLPRIRRVVLHEPVVSGGRRFDSLAFDGDGKLRHVAHHVAEGTRAAVESFLEDVLVAKASRRDASELEGAVLFADTFTEDALAAYLDGLKARSSAVFGALEVLSHREGYVRLGARSGLHVLLVTEHGGERRPLMAA